MNSAQCRLVGRLAAQQQATFEGEYLHEDLFALAGTYAFHIAEAQAFLDGNKRTALDAALGLLALNGYRIEDPERALFDAMIEIAHRRLSKAALRAVAPRACERLSAATSGARIVVQRYGREGETRVSPGSIATCGRA